MAVVVPIVADFDPAGIKSADAAFKSFGQNLSKVLGQASKSAAQSLEAVEDGANDARTAAQRLADGIAQSSATLEADIQKSAAAARALGNALGPELTAKLGTRGVQNLIRDFTRMGLTLEEVAAEADTLATSIRQLDSISVDPLNNQIDRLDDNIRKVGDTTDRSRSVFANFTGNAAQEIPGVAAAMGPLNTAIGQFAEYAAEGGISLAGFAKTIGPLAAVGGAVLLISEAFSASAKNAELLQKNTDVITDAIVAGKDAATEFFNVLREARTIEIFDRQKGIFGDTEDIEEELFRLGIRLSDIELAAGQGIPALKAYRDELDRQREALGKQGDLQGEQLKKFNDLRKVSRFITDFLKAYTDGTNKAAVETFVYGTALTESEAALRAQIDAQVAANPVLFDYSSSVANALGYQESLTAATKASAEEYERQAQAIADSRDELFKYLDVGRNERENARNTAEARAELEKARKKGASKDIVDAEERYLRAVEDEAQYVGEAFVQTSKIRDEKLKQALATQRVIDELESERDLLDPASPLRRNLDEYIRTLREDLPREINTELLLTYATQFRGGMPGIPTLTQPMTGSAGGGGLGNVTINVQTLNPDEASARAIAKSMNREADRVGAPRPFPQFGV